MATPSYYDNPWTDVRQTHQQQQTPTQSQQPQFRSGMGRDEVRQAVTDYYSGRNTAPQGNSVDYWTDKYFEFGDKDPEYYSRFLSNAEEFTGGPAQTAKSMWGINIGGGGGFGGPDPRRDQLYNLLMGRATQSLNIDPKDPIIANQVNAFGAQQQRASRNYLASQAEKQGPLGNLGMEERMASEKAGQATGSLQAQLMQNELGARRQEIMSALSQMGGLLSDNERLALQRELAYLSNDQFLRDLGLRAQQQAWNQNAYSSGLFGL